MRKTFILFYPTHLISSHLISSHLISSLSSIPSFVHFPPKLRYFVLNTTFHFPFSLILSLLAHLLSSSHIFSCSPLFSLLFCLSLPLSLCLNVCISFAHVCLLLPFFLSSSLSLFSSSHLSLYFLFHHFLYICFSLFVCLPITLVSVASSIYFCLFFFLSPFQFLSSVPFTYSNFISNT